MWMSQVLIMHFTELFIYLFALQRTIVPPNRLLYDSNYHKSINFIHKKLLIMRSEIFPLNREPTSGQPLNL